jgi:hypothetical protein
MYVAAILTCLKDAVWANRSCGHKWELLAWAVPMAMYAAMYYKPIELMYVAAIVVHAMLIMCAALAAPRSQNLVVIEWLIHTMSATSVALAWYVYDIGGDDTWVYPSILCLLQIFTAMVATETWLRGCSIIDTALKYIEESSFYIMVTLLCILAPILTGTADVARVVILVFTSLYTIEWWALGTVLILHGPFTLCGGSTALTQRTSDLSTVKDIAIVSVYIGGTVVCVACVALQLTLGSMVMSAVMCVLYITSQF